MKGVMRGFAVAAALLVGLPLLAYLVLAVINRNDEPPSAEAQQLVAMYHDRPALADDANGYVRLLGLSEADPGYRATRSQEVAALATACREAPACVDAVDARPDAIAQWLESEYWLLDGYRRMLASGGWREEVPVEDPAAPSPAFQPAVDGQMLHLLDARRQALAGDAAAVRDLLERDLVFWRQVLASSDLLVTKMVAVAATDRNFELGNLALRALPPGLVDAAVPPSWREPLTVAERSLARPLGGEWHLVTSVLGALPVEAGTGASPSRLADDLLRRLYQEQATRNALAGNMARWGQLSESPYPELDAVLEAMRQEGEPPRFRPYNPVGTVFAHVGTASGYARYIARVADLEGQRRAALLAARLRGAGIGAADAVAAVRDAPLRNPYDDTAFEWDTGSGAVVFRGLEGGDRGRHAVPL